MAENKSVGSMDLTEGPLLKSIMGYSIPLMVGSLIQVLFNAADLAVLGNMADKYSVASVGATGVIVALVVSTFIGISGGTSVVLARYVGANDSKNTSAAIDTSMILALVMGLAVTVMAFFLVDPLLIVTKCPSDCYDGAKLYLLIYFASIPAIMIYNFGAAVLRTGGDSRSPLYYLVACGILNVVLNVILCMMLTENKIVAVAVATVASQILGAVLVTLKLIRSETNVRFNVRKPSFSWKIMWKILRHGIPNGFSCALYSISNIQIQSAINDFGPDMIAGNSAAGNIETIVNAFTSSFATASFAFVGQNIGAKKTQRVKDSIKICLAFGAAIGLVLGVSLTLAGRPALSIFLPGEEAAIEYGLIRMRFVLLFYVIAACNTVNGCIIQAFGKSITPTVINVVTVLLFRFIYMLTVFPKNPTPECLFFCYTISWSLCCISLFAALFIVLYRYKKGKKMKI